MFVHRSPLAMIEQSLRPRRRRHTSASPSAARPRDHRGRVLLPDLKLEHAPNIGVQREGSAESSGSADLAPRLEVGFLDIDGGMLNAFRHHRGGIAGGHRSDFPALAEVGLEILGCLGIARNLAGGGLIIECLARSDGDVAQQHGLGQGRRIIEVRQGDRRLALSDGLDPLTLVVPVDVVTLPRAGATKARGP